MKVQIKDDFLDSQVFLRIKEVFEAGSIDWQFTNGTSEPNGEDLDSFFFAHWIFESHTWISPFSNELEPLLSKMGVMALHMARINLLTRTEEHVESSFHTDYDHNSPNPEKKNMWSTSIFYLNDCNGYTKLEDGTIIKSKANRLLTLPANVKHLGASCTDQKRRLVLNLNYIK